MYQPRICDRCGQEIRGSFLAFVQHVCTQQPQMPTQSKSLPNSPPERDEEPSPEHTVDDTPKVKEMWTCNVCRTIMYVSSKQRHEETQTHLKKKQKLKQ